MSLNAKQKAEFIKDAPAVEPKLMNDPTQLKAVMQLCLRQLALKFKFKTVECLRTIPRQKWLVKNGKSWTDKSRHLVGLAADLFPLATGYKDLKVFEAMHDEWDKIVKQHGRIPEPRIPKDLGHFGILD
jgi:hypothetical protein